MRLRLSKTGPWLLSGLLLSLALVLSGCASMFSYQGALIKPWLYIPLERGGSHTGVFEAHDVIVPYRYSLVSGKLELAGDTELLHGGSTEYFTLRVHFVGADHRILGTKVLVMAPYRHRVENYPFNEEVALPPGTEGIAFSYDGEVSAIGGDDTWQFWLDPRKAGPWGFY